MKPLLLTILLCGLTHLSAQITLAADLGYSIAGYNHSLELSGPTIASDQGDYLGAYNSPTLAFEVDYAPATSRSSWGLRLQYGVRGYRHLIQFDSGQTVEGPLNYSRVDYIDMMPRFTHRYSRIFSNSIGPYISIGLKEEGTPFIDERERLATAFDYGINLETRVTLDRVFFYVAYQRSFREYDYSAATDGGRQPHGDAFSIANPSPISAFRLGVGGMIIR
jgi:hypothetical protein